MFLVVTLWICLFARMAATERTCGTEFDDVGSSALLAPIVLEGRAKRVLYKTGEQLAGSVERPTSRVSVVFDRLRLYKGQLVESSGEVRSIDVGYFSITADREACVAPVPATDRSYRYLLFLRHNDSQSEAASTSVNGTEDDARRLRGRGYRLSAFPVRKSRQNVATVVEFTNCTRCGRAPTVRLMPDTNELRMEESQRLELRCRSRRGRPTPRLVWSRNGVVLADRVNRVRITSSRSGSKLQVRRLREQDAGLYQCQAVNVVGQSERRSIDVVVVPNVEPTRLHSVMCTEHSYCLNGGTCFIILSLGRRYCVCQQGFDGERCEMRVVGGIRPILTGGFGGLNASEAALIMSGVVAAALTIVAVAIIIFSSARQWAVERKERKRRQQQEDTVESAASAGDESYLALRRDTTSSNGRVTRSNRASEQRRSRLQAASATPRSEDLYAVGDLDLSRDCVQPGRPRRSDSLRQTLLLNGNGDHSTRVEKETTC